MSRFQTTRWSEVLEAREGSARSRQALESLCRNYRSPVLAYIRGRGGSNNDIEDLAQAFFARFIERGIHAHADPARGRFRAFLLTALKHFLDNDAVSSHAQKRGGLMQFHSFEELGDSVDGHPQIPDRDTPEQVFERAWAEATLRAAMRKLQAEAAAAGKATLFNQLCGFIVDRPDEAEYVRVGEALGMRRNTVAVAVHRLKHRLRELVREELADTAADERELHEELKDLSRSLAVVLLDE